MTRAEAVHHPILAAMAVLSTFFLIASPTFAIQTCTSNYCVGFCSRYCSDPELGGATSSCEAWLIGEGIPGDTDGIANLSDNCVCTNNTNQANCDGDSKGDVCDSMNGNFVVADRWTACASDTDQHVGFFDGVVEEHRQYEDTSACNAADRWDRRTVTTHCLCTISETDCCELSCSTFLDYFICDPVGGYSFCNPDTIP